MAKMQAGSTFGRLDVAVAQRIAVLVGRPALLFQPLDGKSSVKQANCRIAHSARAAGEWRGKDAAARLNRDRFKKHGKLVLTVNLGHSLRSG
jgi:hypothetical protein